MGLPPEPTSAPNAHTARQERLAAALEQNEFQLWFQPVVELASDRVVGFEGLVRWHDRDGGVTGPAAFIDEIEGGELHYAFTDAMIEQAIEFAKSCQSFGCAPVVAVNLGAKSLSDTGLADRIEARLKHHDVPAQQLVLELTEREVAREVDDARLVLASLEAVGLGLSIDDFGTGYSSLDRLRRIPFSELKIDRSFVTGIDVDPEALIIVQSIIRLARLLHLSVVAEGVERIEQLELLRNARCDRAQGFFFERPMPRDQAGALLRRSVSRAADAQPAAPEQDVSLAQLEIRIDAEELEQLLDGDEQQSIAGQLLRALPVPVFIKGVDGRFIWSNDSHLRRLGFDSLEDIRRRTDLDVHEHAEAMRYRADDLYVLTSGVPVVDRNELQTRADGTCVSIRTSKFPIRNNDGEIVGLVGFYLERGAAGDTWLERDLAPLGQTEDIN